MFDVTPILEPALTPEAVTWLNEAEAALAEKGAPHLAILFPQLARRIGRHGLGGTQVEHEGCRVDLGSWRACDAAGARLIAAGQPSDEQLVDLFRHGDMEERTIVLRSLALRPITAATVELLGEIQRTNTQVHFEAGGLDSNIVVRAVDAGVGFDEADYQRFVLKMAFADLPIERVDDGLRFASAELSRMLQDFATEREAAGRAVWVDTYRFIGQAPTDGSLARLIGGLEHGDDNTRLAAAEGARNVGGDQLARFAAERMPRERRENVRGVLGSVR